MHPDLPDGVQHRFVANLWPENSFLAIGRIFRAVEDNTDIDLHPRILEVDTKRLLIRKKAFERLQQLKSDEVFIYRVRFSVAKFLNRVEHPVREWETIFSFDTARDIRGTEDHIIPFKTEGEVMCQSQKFD